MMSFDRFDHGSPFPSSNSNSILSPLADPFSVFGHALIPAPQHCGLEDPFQNWLHLLPSTSNFNHILFPTCTQSFPPPATHFLPFDMDSDFFPLPNMEKSSPLERESCGPFNHAGFGNQGFSNNDGFTFGASTPGVFLMNDFPESGGCGHNSSGFDYRVDGKSLLAEEWRTDQKNCGESSQLGSTFNGSVSTMKRYPSSFPGSSALLLDASSSQLLDLEATKAWNSKSESAYNKCFAPADKYIADPKSFYSTWKFSENIPVQSCVIDPSKIFLNSGDPAASYGSKTKPTDCTNTCASTGCNEVNPDKNSNDAINDMVSAFSSVKTESSSLLRPKLPLRSSLEMEPKLKDNPFPASDAFPPGPGVGISDGSGCSTMMPNQCLPIFDSTFQKGALPQYYSFNTFDALSHPPPPIIKELEGHSDSNKPNQPISNDSKCSGLLQKSSGFFSDFGSGCDKNDLIHPQSRCGDNLLSFYDQRTSFPPCIHHANKSGPGCFCLDEGCGIPSSPVAMQDLGNEISFKLKPAGMELSSLRKDSTCSIKPSSIPLNVDLGIDCKKEAKNGSSDFLSDLRGNMSRVSSSRISIANENGVLNETLHASRDQSSPILDTAIMIKMIHNLSELLRSSHDYQVNTLKENDYGLLQLAINNLHVYSLKKDDSTTPILEGSSFCPMKSLNSQEAIEKCMKERIPEPKEKLPEMLLYRNLWIESEAALCSMKYERRLAQMKIESEKHEDRHTVEGLSKPNCSHKSSVNGYLACKLNDRSSKKVVEALSKSNYSYESHEDEPLACKYKDSASNKADEGLFKSKCPHEYHRDESIPCKLNYCFPKKANFTEVQDGGNPIEGNQQVHDLEASVTAKLKILQDKVESWRSMCNALLIQKPDANDGVEQNGRAPSHGYVGRQLDAVVDESLRNVEDPVMLKLRPFIERQWEDRRFKDAEVQAAVSDAEFSSYQDSCSPVSTYYSLGESLAPNESDWELVLDKELAW